MLTNQTVIWFEWVLAAVKGSCVFSCWHPQCVLSVIDPSRYILVSFFHPPPLHSIEFLTHFNNDHIFLRVHHLNQCENCVWKPWEQQQKDPIQNNNKYFSSQLFKLIQMQAFVSRTFFNNQLDAASCCVPPAVQDDIHQAGVISSIRLWCLRKRHNAFLVHGHGLLPSVH